jgi:hypothetical protein
MPREGKIMTITRQTVIAGALGAAVMIGSAFSVSTAQAGYVVKVQQDGSDIVANGSGAIDLTGLTFDGDAPNPPGLHPSIAYIITGTSSGADFDTYAFVTGPTSFGSGGNTDASSASGDVVGVFAGGQVATVGFVVVPHGYTSDTALSDSASYDNQTFSSLGLTDGTYEWTWGAGADQNFTLIIGGTFTPTPEPSALALLGTAFTGLFLFGARRRMI